MKTEDELRAIIADLACALEAVLPWAEKWVLDLDARSHGELYPAIRAATLQRARDAIARAKGDDQ